MDISSLVADHNRWWTDPSFRRARLFPQRRALFQSVLSYLGEAPQKRAALLVGPRQVGKTTLLLQLADHLLDQGWPAGNLTFFDFSDDRLITPTSPRDIVAAEPPSLRHDYPRLFLLDEIQEAEHWQRWLKGAVDESHRQSPTSRSIFIVTGSSAGALKDGDVESGQGRWNEILIEGLTYREFVLLNAGDVSGNEDTALETALGRDPTLFSRYLSTGGFPEYALPPVGRDPLPEIRDDIINRAILRDLRRTGVDIERVRRLFVYLVNESGGIWIAQSRAQDLNANRKSVEEWLTLLEDIRLICGLPPDHAAHAKAATQLRARYRVYASDHGLISALSRALDPLGDPDVRGKILEAAVFRHLREVHRENPGGRLGYFRARDDLEIDFVWRPVRGRPVGIEVTAGSRLRSRKIDRLSRAAADAGIERRLLIYDGVLATRDVGIEMVPAHRFLLNPSECLAES